MANPDRHGPHPARTVGLAAVAVVVAVLALVVAALVYTRSVGDSVDEGIDQRDAARVSACVAYNVDIVRLRAALQDSLVALVPPGATLTADQQARVAAYDAAVEQRLVFRDCSPAGITAFYASPPVDPATSDGP